MAGRKEIDYWCVAPKKEAVSGEGEGVKRRKEEFCNFLQRQPPTQEKLFVIVFDFKKVIRSLIL